MPGPLLSLESVVTCDHGGVAEPLVPYPLILLDGAPVVALDSPYLISGCCFPPPPIANGPCVLGTWIVGDFAVFASGIPVLVEGGVAITELSCVGLLPFANPQFDATA